MAAWPAKSATVAICLSSMATMTSPGSRPAFSAELASSTSTTTTPLGRPPGDSTPKALANSLFSGCTMAPTNPRFTSPLSINWASTALTMLAGMAKPMPTLPPVGAKMAVLMPTRSPRKSTSAPPELPGLIGASV